MTAAIRPLFRGLLPLALAWMTLAAPAMAVLPDEQLDDPVLEARAREISAGLRCVVCQSENIDGSNAELARDMRIRVRDLLVAGKTNEEIIQYMVDRYGDYVLMNPPFKATTYALWFGPIVILVIGAVGVRAYYRGRAKPAGPGGGAAPVTGGPSLSEEEQRRLDALLRETEAEAENEAEDRPTTGDRNSKA